MVKFDIEEETQTEFQTFLEENGSDIAEQVLHEYAEANIIVAIDDNGNVAKEFHSFDEIISYFNVTRADNVKMLSLDVRRVHMDMVGNIKRLEIEVTAKPC